MAHEKDVLAVRESFVPLSRQVRSRRVFVAKPKPRKDESIMGILCSWLVDHQIGISLNLLTLLGLVHLFFPRARRRTRKFFELSYRDPDTGLYSRGLDDLYYVFFWLVIFTGMRAAIMDYILKPFAQWGGIRTKKGRVRFAEQGWVLIYYSVFWTIGMHIWYNSTYFLNLKELWTNFPIIHLEAKVKWYYIVQFACYLQQLFVVNIEERRKDHWQMFTHHVFTSALLLASYGFYQIKVGNVILCIMDIGDILLPLAKCLNYLGFRMACDIVFGVFLVAWFLCRHVAYLIVCRSIYLDMANNTLYGCYDSVTGKRLSENGGSSVLANVLQPFNDPNGLVCFNAYIRNGFLSLLLALQVLTLIWFGMILRVAYGVLSGKAAEDNRSEDEESDMAEDDEIDEFEVEEESRALEKGEHRAATLPVKQGPVVDVATDEAVDEARNTNNRVGSPVASGSNGNRGRRTRASARTSAISIPGHGDRKELLGRIGCDKPT